MTTTRLLFLVSNCMFWPVIGLYIIGLVTRRTYCSIACPSFVFEALGNAIQRHWTHSTIDWLFAAWLYWWWKNSPDDDDKPKRKRAALRSKFDKVLPKPVDTPVHNPG